jgi:hypothetical protein
MPHSSFHMGRAWGRKLTAPPGMAVSPIDDDDWAASVPGPTTAEQSSKTPGGFDARKNGYES